MSALVSLVLILFISASECSATDTGSPRLLEFVFPPQVALGDEIIVPCVVRKGTTGPYRIQWRKDGGTLEDSGRVSVSSAHSKSSATLRIASLRPEDVGNYTCTAANSFGSDSFTAALIVHGKLWALSCSCGSMKTAPVPSRNCFELFFFTRLAK
ncbi:hypothetical protein V5799_008406 [Amblyomma americanum]|uniref:Ig-like domain-containing protein n=1 Tax=Amblyomma americanum TaxID=6943 RepID=A0AAQ4FEH9_AMBAM